VYAWQGRLEHERERQVIIKTTAARLDALKLRLAGLHPYDVPELLVLAVDDGAEAYLAWLRGSTDWTAGAGQS
jgi:periplasmic divalent cation tolerance protein